MITVEHMAVGSVGTCYLVMPIRIAFMHDITSGCFLVLSLWFVPFVLHGFS